MEPALHCDYRLIGQRTADKLAFVTNRGALWKMGDIGVGDFLLSNDMVSDFARSGAENDSLPWVWLPPRGDELMGLLYRILKGRTL